jgi:hypothetical protein
MNTHENMHSVSKKHNPQAEVMNLLQQAMAMGRNDYEPSEFNRITMGLNAGTITPEEALTQVHKMMDSKQDYN